MFVTAVVEPVNDTFLRKSRNIRDCGAASGCIVTRQQSLVDADVSRAGACCPKRDRTFPAFILLRVTRFRIDYRTCTFTDTSDVCDYLDRDREHNHRSVYI